MHVFGRRRFGLTPLLPQLLHKLDFYAAVHATLDDGNFPEGSQVKTRWEGLDGTAFDALARAPLNASEPGTFLGLALKLGESMDMDHVATVSLAHWPGQASPWYEDLRPSANTQRPSGHSSRSNEFFATRIFLGHLDRFTADKYVSPYLKQAIIRKEVDPISSVQRDSRKEDTAPQGRGRTSKFRGGDRKFLSDSKQPRTPRKEVRMSRQRRRAILSRRGVQNFSHALPRTASPRAGC